MSATAVSRRQWIRSLFAPGAPSEPEPDAPAADVAMVAVISGRNCLAYQRSFCSTCVERCPVEGAITSERGLPRVNPDACTGCNICTEVCPAPGQAILMVPARKPSSPHVRT